MDESIKPQLIFRVPRFWVSFWLIYVIGVLVVTWGGKFAFATIFHPDMVVRHGMPTHPMSFIYSMAVLQAIYVFFAWAMVWKSAVSASRIWHRIVARTITSIHGLYVFVLILKAIYISSSVLSG